MNTLKSFATLILAMMFFALSGALRASDISEYAETLAKQPAPRVGQEYYLRNCLWQENGIHDATNYTRGEMVPVNTKITLEGYIDNTIWIRINSTGAIVRILNVAKYTKKKLHAIARNMLSPSEITFDGISKELAEAIQGGEMKPGMTKQQVLMARGWPPAHKTRSLDEDTWVYWPSRFVQQTIVFKDGKLTGGRGIR
ncbi:MAG: outer membrane protein assembly factor BamE [Opitutaceae bacterium]|jgi:hypothetical protein|nr:outer membrane protein assembly factor BamE [Opitutaceae bacterium]